MKTPALRTLHTAALALALTSAGCEGPAGLQGPPGAPGTAGAPGAPGSSATVDPALAPVDKALTAIGGKEALQALESFSFQIAGTHFIANEGYTPEADAFPTNTYSATVTHDVKNGGLHIDTQRTLRALFAGTQQSFKTILRGNLGYLDGTESAFGMPGGNLGSDRLAAELKQQRLLNPHLLLRDVAATPSLASDGGLALFDGSVHHLVTVQDAVAPVTLYVHAQTGLISKLSTFESDHLERDVPLEVHYLGWQQAGAGALRFPSQVLLSHNGHLTRTETRSAVTVNGTVSAALFDFPTGASPTFVQADADRGALSSQFHLRFSNIGVPLDGMQTQVFATEVAPNVFHLKSYSHHSMAVVQQNGVVVIEAPLYQERSEALINWVKENHPGKAITHVVSSHFHEDHSAGLRTFVPEGARVVVGAPAARFMRHVFQAPSNLRKDALALKPTPAQLDTVAVDGSFTIADANLPVTAYHVRTTHAADMLMVYVGGTAKVLFSSDIYSPGNPNAPAGAAELYRSITEQHQVDVATIVGAHGNETRTVAQLKTEAGL